MTFLIAAAGTGGHVFPGLAVGRGLIDIGVNKGQIVYVGGDRLESEVYPAAGFDFLGLELQGLKRSASASNLRLPGVVRKATAAIRQLVADRQVRVALGLGGYVTIPTAMAARREGIALMVAEQNAGAGLANRLAGRFASRQFVSFPDTKGLARGEWVGNPVRKSIREFDRSRTRARALTRYGLSDGVPVLGVFGGSLGASAINDAVAAGLLHWDAGEIQVVHIAGERDQQRMSQLATRARLKWIVMSFENDMADFYAVSDLVVARAGGGIAELTATGTPSILIPGEFGSSGHQRANARFLEDAGASLVIDEAHAADVGARAAELIFDAGRLTEMAQAARSIAKPNAALSIAEAMVEAS